jgi:hypothetical protein
LASRTNVYLCPRRSEQPVGFEGVLQTEAPVRSLPVMPRTALRFWDNRPTDLSSRFAGVLVRVVAPSLMSIRYPAL